MSVYDAVTANMADATERALVLALFRAGDEYDAASDGSLHHAYPSDVADRKYWEVRRAYDVAGKALADYRRARAS